MIKLAICFLFAAFFNAVMDKLQFHDLFKGNPFWDPKLSWERKYRDHGHTVVANIIEKLDNTVFVFLTDGWHHMQWWMLHCFTIAAIPEGLTWLNYLVWFIGLRVIFGGAFTLFFHHILKSKTP